LESNLVSETPQGVDESVPRFTAESVRNLGTPVFPNGNFSALRKTFGQDCDRGDQGKRRAVSAVLNF